MLLLTALLLASAVKASQIPLAGPGLSRAEPESAFSTFSRASVGSEKVSREPCDWRIPYLPRYEWLGALGDPDAPYPRPDYMLAQLEAASIAAFGEKGVWECVTNRGRSHLVGVSWPLITLPSTCPDSEEIVWIPGLRYGVATSPVPTGAITLSVMPSTAIGVLAGCLDESGWWRVQAKCAHFQITSHPVVHPNLHWWESKPENDWMRDGNFTLATKKGPCSIHMGALSCAMDRAPTFFQAERGTNMLVFNGSTSFAAPFQPESPICKSPVILDRSQSTVNTTLFYTIL
ncbi:hypothetical protein RQP46_001158 [Phenoliferia psychrophenolica]